MGGQHARPASASASAPAMAYTDSLSSDSAFAHLRVNGSVDPKKAFRKVERTMLRQTFNDLASRSQTGKTIDQETFMRFFSHLPGILGERLFIVFSCGGSSIDFNQFLAGVAVYSRGSIEEKIKCIFKMYNLSGSGEIVRSELESVLNAFVLACAHVDQERQSEQQRAALVEEIIRRAQTLSQTNTATTTATAAATGANALAVACSSSSDVLSPPFIGLSVYSFARLIQEYPHILDILDLAFADKEEAYANFYNKQTGASISVNPLSEPVSGRPLSVHYFNPLTPHHSAALDFIEPAIYKQETQTTNNNANRLSGRRFSTPAVGGGSSIASAFSCSPCDASGRLLACPQCRVEFLVKHCMHCGLRLKFDDTPQATGPLPYSPCSPVSCVCVSSSVTPVYCVSCGFDLREAGKKIEPPLFPGRVKARMPVMEGPLLKVGQRLRNILSRYYVLKESFLYSYEKSSDVRPSHVLSLSGCFVERVNHEERSAKLKYGIEIIINEEPRKSRLLYCASEESRQHWLEAIRVHTNVHRIEDYYSLHEELGVGRFSTVRSATSRTTGKQYAVKIIDKGELAESEREALRSEVAVLKLLDHPHIVRLKNVFETRKEMFLVMNLVSGGDLFDRLVKRKRYSESAARLVMYRLLTVVAYLHSRGVVHRDLKPENIFLASPTDDTDIRVGDFGLSKFTANADKLTQQCGSLAYVSPEVLKKAGYGKEVDLWSCGIILFLLIKGALPFDGADRDAIIIKTVEGRLSFDDAPWPATSPAARDVVSGLLRVDPQRRLSATQALQHEWFNNIETQIQETETEAETETQTQTQSRTLSIDPNL